MVRLFEKFFHNFRQKSVSRRFFYIMRKERLQRMLLNPTLYEFVLLIFHFLGIIFCMVPVELTETYFLVHGPFELGGLVFVQGGFY